MFGHIHEGYGVTKQKKLKTYFINASTCNLTYRPNQAPILFYIAGNRGNDLFFHRTYRERFTYCEILLRTFQIEAKFNGTDVDLLIRSDGYIVSFVYIVRIKIIE